MAALWRVTHPDFDCPLVMKMPFIAWGDDPGAIVGFEVEQMILPRLSGPHVPRFIAAAFSDHPYLVMERIQGSSLKALVADLPRPPEEVAAIGAKVAFALHDIHRQHVIHFDVKPSNVMLRDSGEAALIDFGLSRHERMPDLLAEETRLPVGTAAYIAPEQVHGVRSDPRSDLFALGVLLYVVLTESSPSASRRPPPECAPASIATPCLRARCGRTARHGCRSLLRCLEVDPRRRHQTGAQLALDLKNPEQVGLTERAERQRQDRLAAVAKRWLRTRGGDAGLPIETVSAHLAQAPIIMAAVDLAPEFGSLADALRLTVQRILSIQPAARLTCVNVLKTALLSIGGPENTGGANPYLQRLVELKAWARPLAIDEDRISFHILEAVDPAAALVDDANRNHVDHIVIGARGSSTVRRYLGSVSSHVVGRSPAGDRGPRAGESSLTATPATSGGRPDREPLSEHALAKRNRRRLAPPACSASGIVIPRAYSAGLMTGVGVGARPVSSGSSSSAPSPPRSRAGWCGSCRRARTWSDRRTSCRPPCSRGSGAPGTAGRPGLRWET